LSGARLRHLEHPPDLWGGEKFRDRLAPLGGLDLVGGVARNALLGEQIAKKVAQRRQVAGYAAGAQPPGVEPKKEFLNLAAVTGEWIGVGLTAPPNEIAQIPAVSG